MNKRYNSLVGNQYGKLLVLSRGPDYVSPKHQRHTIRYYCQCVCGTITLVKSTALTSGGTQSCGCSRKTSLLGKNLIDLTGQRFGYWSVVRRAADIVEPSGAHVTMWLCKCDCGTVKPIRSHSLLSGTTHSCGCYKKKNLRSEVDLCDHRYGRWSVVSFDKVVKRNGRKYRMWKCRCDCGTERSVDEKSLLTGKSKSCGCYRLERLRTVTRRRDLKGKRYGHWTVIDSAPDQFYPGGGRGQQWKCRCDCGKERIVLTHSLVTGFSKSCGCQSQSRLESTVDTWLQRHGFSYRTQVKFDDLRGVGNRRLSYDFLIYLKDGRRFLLECQGVQHYRPFKYFGGVAKYNIQQQHDQLKRQYALDHHYIFLEISFELSDNQIKNYLKNHF